MADISHSFSAPLDFPFRLYQKHATSGCACSRFRQPAPIPPGRCWRPGPGSGRWGTNGQGNADFGFSPLLLLLKWLKPLTVFI